MAVCKACGGDGYVLRTGFDLTVKRKPCSVCREQAKRSRKKSSDHGQNEKPED